MASLSITETVSWGIALGANGARAIASFAAPLLQVALFWFLAGALLVAALGLLAAPTRVREG